MVAKGGGGDGKNPSLKAEELSEGQEASPDAEAKPECLFRGVNFITFFNYGYVISKMLESGSGFSEHGSKTPVRAKQMSKVRYRYLYC
jgi:hypothetical protein